VRGLAWLIVALGACRPGADSATPKDTHRPEDTGPWDDTGPPDDTAAPSLSLVLGDRVELGAGAFARVVVREGGFELAAVDFTREHWLRGFDATWQPDGRELLLAEPGPREPDLALADSPWGLVHARLTKDDDGPGMALQRLDTDWSVQARSDQLTQGDDEHALDPSLLVADDRVWLGSEYRQEGERWQDNQAPDEEVERGLLLRELSLDLEPLATHVLTGSLPGAAPERQFWGLGAAQLRDEGAHWVFAAASGGALEHFGEGESAGGRRLWALEFDHDFALREAHGPLTPADRDSYWCTGVARIEGYTLLATTVRRPEDGPVLGPPSPDVGNIALLLLDEEMRVLEQIVVTEHGSEEIAQGKGAHRAGLAVQGRRAWLSWDGPGSLWIQELELKED
jgi:hypothetical protein